MSLVNLNADISNVKIYINPYENRGIFLQSQMS